ncbi:hypothetical protein [Phycicoccus avicenniae]|uniref:hypothetical protein n=1 Tax=Phycicoccus avicenniae TaxID=2828860 RepID=UPI003D2A7221
MGVRTRLTSALDDRSFVRLVRSPKHADPLDGFVVAVGEAWGVMHATTEGGYFDGYSAFRLRDVKKVRVLTDVFAAEFARTLSTWPPESPPGLRLDSTVGVIESMAAASPLIGIEQENRRSALWIGRLDEARRKWTWLLEVRPDATWKPEPLGYRTKHISRVTIESMYQRALHRVTEPPPL